MKTLLGILVSFFIAAGAFASDVPSCWKDESRVKLKDGEFILTIRTKDLRKEEIVRLMDKLDGGYLMAKSYPVIFGMNMIITTMGYDAGVGEYKLPRAKFKRTVEDQLAAAVRGLPGISIECNKLIRTPR